MEYILSKEADKKYTKHTQKLIPASKDSKITHFKRFSLKADTLPRATPSTFQSVNEFCHCTHPHKDISIPTFTTQQNKS